MKNVFYLNCMGDPWIKVAQRLQKECDLQPVYWTGFSFKDASDKSVVEAFPDILYVEDSKTWRGVFPDKIAKIAEKTYIDVDFIREYAYAELLTMKMMDRLDADRYSYNFMERQRAYRNMVRSWMAAIQMYKPYAIISANVPHHVSDYVLYFVCKYYNIPFVFLYNTSFAGRSAIHDNVLSIDDSFTIDYNKELLKNDSEIRTDIAEDVFQRCQNIQNDYNAGKPAFMSRDDRQNKEADGFFKMVIKFFKFISDKNPHQPMFGENGIAKIGVVTHYKRRNVPVEENGFSLYQYSKMRLKSIRFMKRMSKFYKSLVEEPDYSEPYILYGVHYQPEATTSPCGDIFVDQRLCIDLLLKNLPENYKIYVKEHPHQYMYHREGQTSRIKEFYTDLKKNPRIVLLDTNADTFNLMKSAKAVATIVGTIGLESICYNIPLICFGFSWYEYAPGVLRVRDEISAKGIYEFINNYKPDEHARLAYLAALSQNTKRAYISYREELFNKYGVKENECVDNIVAMLRQKLNV